MLEINQRRALEGEIARTLRTLDRVDDAIVHLAVTESVIDIRGRTLATPNSGTETGALGNRNMRRTREFEQQLESDISRMLLTTGAGDRATVVVQADLNFDETTIQQQSYDNESQVALRESSRLEEFPGDGSGSLPSGITGGAVPTAEQVRELVSAAVGLDSVSGRVSDSSACPDSNRHADQPGHQSSAPSSRRGGPAPCRDRADRDGAWPPRRRVGPGA
jgi:flagellar biosynthesis/type III secretory pathway M-ring protein FliF/YscJ